MLKRFLQSIGVVIGVIAFTAVVVNAAATPISVPSAAGGGYWLVSTTTGAYVASSTNQIYVGSVNATSTTASSTFPLAQLGTTTVSNLNGVIVVDGVRYAKTSDGIKSAVGTCSTNSCAGVYLPAGIYTVNSRITPKSNIHIFGAGKGITILQGSVSSDWVFYYSSATQLSNFSISDLTIDLQNGTAASGIQLSNASTTVIQNISFLNGAASGWFLVYGTPTSATDPVENFNNKIIDVDFTNHAGSLEALLVYNATSTQIIRPNLRNISSPGIGLWQKDYGTKIISPTITDSSNGSIYYSVTVEDTTISDAYFQNAGGGISGANTSDNGNFGLSQAQDLKVINPILIGGSNSTTGTGIQIGSVNNVIISNPIVENYQVGIAINTGNNSNTAAATNWSIINPQILNNNATNNFAVLHPGIFFSGIGGSLYGTITGGNIYDNLNGYQYYPIAFDGAFTWDNISITNNRLNKANTGTSIGLADSAALGSNVYIYANKDYSGSNPAQSLISLTSGVSGILPILNGGTATSTFSSGGVVYSDGTKLTQNTANLFWDNTNKRLGIGGNSPQQSLDVNGNSLFGNDIYTVANKGIFFSGSGNFNAGIYGRNSGNDLVFNAGSSERMRILSGGNVGIGTTTPDYKLHIQDNTGANDNLVHIGDSYTNSGGTRLLIENRWSGDEVGNEFMKLQRSPSSMPFFTVMGSGRIGIGTSSPTAVFDLVGFDNTTIAPFQVSTLAGYSTTTRLIVSGTGNVGINIANPSSKLTVQDTTSADATTPTVLITGDGNFAKTSIYLKVLGNAATDSGTTTQITNLGTGPSLEVKGQSDGSSTKGHCFKIKEVGASTFGYMYMDSTGSMRTSNTSCSGTGTTTTVWD